MRKSVSFLSLAAIALTPVLLSAQVAVFNNIPSPLPPNDYSVGYEATQTAELGGVYTAAPGLWQLSNIKTAISNWAYCSEWALLCASNASGYNEAMTLSVYSVDAFGNVNGTLGTSTAAVLVPWRPEPSTSCDAGSNNNWKASDGSCYSGQLSVVTWDFTSQNITLPGTFGVGLAFNTQDAGYSPTGVSGPWNSLNFAIDDPAAGGAPVALGDDQILLYAGTGDTGVTAYPWTSEYYTPEITVNATASAVTPEPATLSLMATGLVGLAGAARRKRNRKATV